MVSIDGHSNKAMADQIMAVDKAQLKIQLSSINKADMKALEDAIRLHFGLAQ